MTKASLEVGDSVTLDRKIAEEDIEAFANLSLDRNPVHFDDDFASRTIFGKRIAHGMISASLVSGALTELIGPGNIWLSANFEFKKPVFIDDTVTCRLTVSAIERRNLYTMEVEILNHGDEQVLAGIVQSMKSY